MATVTPANQTAIANLYVALFNRAPDAAGFAFWTQALADGASISTIAQGFVKSPEARAIYSESQTSTQFVAAYYTSVLGRAPDASGLAFWTAALDAAGGSSSDGARAYVVSQIVNTVNTPLPVKPSELTDAAYALTFADRNVFVNKAVVGVYYATEYKGTDLVLAKHVLTVVSATGSTVDIAKGMLTGGNTGGTTSTPPVVEPPVVVGPQHFVGTVSADNFVGGAGNDTFTFVIDKNMPVNTTLTTKDTLTGGAGDDTLTVTTTGAVTNPDFSPIGISISGIETLVLQRTAASSVAVNAWAGLTNVDVKGGTGALRLDDLGSKAKVSLNGTSNGAVTLVYELAATDTTLALTGGVSGHAVEFQAGGLTSIALTSSGSANALNSLLISPQVTALNIVADTALTVSAMVGNSVDVNVSGIAAVNLGTLNDISIKSVDASANSGGLTAAVHTNNRVVAIKGSSGNDVISTGVALTTGTVDAGAGTADRLIVTNTAALNSAALGAKYTNFEILQIENGVSVDLANISGITSVEINDGAGTTTVVNLNAAQASAVTILTSNPTGFIAFAPAVGVDTIKATVNTTVGIAAQAIDLTGMAVNAGVTKLELTGNGAAGATAGLVTLTTANTTTLTSIVVKNEGGASITVGGGHTGTNLSIDASGSAGAVTINGSAYGTLTALTIKGGSGTNILTGSTRGDTIIGGAGNDTINAGITAVGSGVDTLTGGAGADTFVFSVANNNTAHGAVTAVITDFKGGEDKINLAVATLSGASAFEKALGVAVDLNALLSAADTALNGTVRAYVGQVDGGDTYVVADLDGNGYSEVIKLTGVSLADIGLGDFVLLTPP